MKLYKIMLATGILLLTTGCEDEYAPREVKPPVTEQSKKEKKKVDIYASSYYMYEDFEDYVKLLPQDARVEIVISRFGIVGKRYIGTVGEIPELFTDARSNINLVKYDKYNDIILIDLRA